jgi:hypothetical protein
MPNNNCTTPDDHDTKQTPGPIVVSWRYTAPLCAGLLGPRRWAKTLDLFVH